nr:basic proline-rich protein-like [Aegilops tauschii subsp. strangulata]
MSDLPPDVHRRRSRPIRAHRVALRRPPPPRPAESRDGPREPAAAQRLRLRARAPDPAPPPSAAPPPGPFADTAAVFPRFRLRVGAPPPRLTAGAARPDDLGAPPFAPSAATRPPHRRALHRRRPAAARRPDRIGRIPIQPAPVDLAPGWPCPEDPLDQRSKRVPEPSRTPYIRFSAR